MSAKKRTSPAAENCTKSSSKESKKDERSSSEPVEADAVSISDPTAADYLENGQSKGNEPPSANVGQPDALDREKVVELAVTLVAAQITATANLETSRQMTANIKRIAVEYLKASARLKSDLESPRNKPDLIDLAFVDHACAQLNQAADATIATPIALLPLDHAGLNDLFLGAMARAQQLLRSPLSDIGIIYAEQLFTPEEIVTENKLGDRFKEWQWPGLRNRETFHKFMVRVEQWFAFHLEEILSGADEKLHADLELVADLLKIGNERKSGDLLQRISELVRTYTQPFSETESGRGSFEHVADSAWRLNLITDIFGGRRPTPRSAIDPKITRSYQPWGLFRYLRLWGPENDAEVQEIVSQLQSQRGNLRLDLSPNPLSSRSRYDFGPST